MIFDDIDQFVSQHRLVMPGQTVIVGFSGGPDSLFLLSYLVHIRIRENLTLIAAHLDHEWRSSSVDDRLFCERWCADHKVTLVAQRAADIAVPLPRTCSKEECGRVLRRAFFQDVKRQYAANTIALAHHADDQLETFFIRLIRGASVAGLACMRPRSGDYIRPLLDVHKKDILDYLTNRDISYAIDPTNESLDFLRNRIRLLLMPVIARVDARAPKNIQRVIAHMQETDIFLNTLVLQSLDSVSDIHQQLIIKDFLALDIFLQKLIVPQWLYRAGIQVTVSAALVDEIIRFLGNKKSTSHQFNQWRIIKRYGCAQIEKNVI